MYIKIYTTPSCVYCKMAKDFFAKHSISYEEQDVSEDPSARDEIMKKSHQLGVPVIEIDEQIFVGFHRAEIAKALGIDQTLPHSNKA